MDIKRIVRNALAEDIGEGDQTSLAIFTDNAQGEASLVAKEEGILAGILVIKSVYKTFDKTLRVSYFKNDGDGIEPGDVILFVSGSIQSILATERVVLNFLQRLSGIATITHRVVCGLKRYNTRLLDTRKTTPGLRELEKYAVRTGGGINHRMGLHDMIMIKNNHIDYAGGVKKAIEQAVNYLSSTGKKLKIEVEVRNFKELLDVLEKGQVDRIMLDNFSPKDLMDAVKIINGRFETEASGGITPQNFTQYAETGVDFISMGALTHSFKSLDMSMKAKHIVLPANFKSL